MEYQKRGGKIPPLAKKDLDVIKYAVEKEFRVSLRSKSRLPIAVNAKRAFVSLVWNVYNRMQEGLGSSNTVTLMALAKYLRYKSHASICLHISNSHKGNITAEEYLMRDPVLKDKYLRLKSEIEKKNSSDFRKFLLLRREELKEELRVIDKYLGVTNEKRESKSKKKTAL